MGIAVLISIIFTMICSTMALLCFNVRSMEGAAGWIVINVYAVGIVWAIFVGYHFAAKYW